MSLPDIHTLTGAYAAHALEEPERTLFEEHLRQCPACREEVAELTATTSRLASAAALPPPPALRERVMAEVARTRQAPPTSTVGRTADRRRRWYLQPVAAAAALFLVVAAGLGVVAVQQDQRADRAERRAAQIAAIATDPDRVERTAQVSTGGTGTVLVADGRALFRAHGLEMLPEGRAYQLWVITPNGPQSAGVLGRGGQVEALVEHMTPADSLGLTVEPVSGSTEPTGELVLRVAMA